MIEAIRFAFEQRVVVLALDNILPLRQVSDTIKASPRYKRIEASIMEVGIIEPIVVAPPQGTEHRHLLLDGHLRLAVLIDKGAVETSCLIATDDEAFTYNRRVNRLATIQEHYMILRALDRGVSAERLARALDIDPLAIQRRLNMLQGICAEAIDILKDKTVNRNVFDSMRRMKPVRQIEAAELMILANNFTMSYARALLAGTRQHDMAFSNKPKVVKGLTPEQMTRMEREMEALQDDFKAVESSYGDDVLNLVLASGYISKMIGNFEIHGYLERHYPDILREFRVIISATSLDQSDPAPT